MLKEFEECNDDLIRLGELYSFSLETASLKIIHAYIYKV